MIQSPPLFELGLDSGGAISAEELAIAAEMPCLVYLAIGQVFVAQPGQSDDVLGVID